MKKTLVIGAAAQPERYSHTAVLKLKRHQHEVVAIGKSETQIGNTLVQVGQQPFADVHTVTLYVNATLQQQYYNYVVQLRPERVIFNPGTENPEFVRLLAENGIAALEACTLVMLATGQY